MAFSLKNSKIYIINLDNDTHAWEITKTQFLNKGLQIERFSAIDGRKLSVPDFCPNSGAKVVLKNGEYGCWLSHLAVIKEASERKLDYVIIFEDDVELCDDFVERLNYLENCQIDFDLFYFGGCFGHHHKFTKTKDSYIYQFTGAAGTHGYIMSKSLFEFVMSNYRFDMAIDGFYSKAIGLEVLDSRFANDHKFDVKGFLPLAVNFRSRISSISNEMHTSDNRLFQKSPLIIPKKDQ